MIAKKAKQIDLEYQADRVKNLTRKLTSLERAFDARKDDEISVPITDTAGEKVLCDRVSDRYRLPKYKGVSISKFLMALEGALDIEVCYDQNERKLVVYDRE